MKPASVKLCFVIHTGTGQVTPNPPQAKPTQLVNLPPFLVSVRHRRLRRKGAETLKSHVTNA